MSYLRTKHKIKLSINDFLPRGNGPGFNSTPDIIKSFWFTLDMTNRFDNIINEPNGPPDEPPEKAPILDLY